MKPLLLLLACTLASALQAQTYSSFKNDRRDTIHGHVVEDPYRKLEDTADAAVKAWMLEQNQAARTFFESMPGNKDLRRQLEAAMRGSEMDEISELQVYQGSYYAIKRYPNEDNFNLYRIDRNGKEQLLLHTDQHFGSISSKNKMLSHLRFNPAGNQLLYFLTVGDYETMPKMVLRDLATGKEWSDTLYLNGRHGKMIAAFDPGRPDAFYYQEYPFFNQPGVEPGHWWDSSRIFHHVVGDDPSTDRLIIDFNTSIINRGVDDELSLLIEKDLPYVFAIVRNNVLYDTRIYYAPKASLNGVATPWKALTDYPDKIREHAVAGHYLYLLGKKDASNGKLMRIDLTSGTLTTLIPHSRMLLNTIGATKDGLVVTALENGTGKLLFIPHGSTTVKTLSIPLPGFVDLKLTHRGEKDFVVSVSSWTRPTAYFDWKGSEGVFRPSILQRYKPATQVPLEQKTVLVKSHDGVEVPMTIIHKKGLVLDGSHPVIMRGYGSYGMQDNPVFWPEDEVYYGNGGIRAIAHVRGGGVYGEDWHLAGQKENKPNTWKDFIACGEYLVRHRYATSQNLVVSGGSAGGITVGRAITERPDLFGGAIISVGALDMVRFEAALNGPANVPEFGSVKTEAGFKTLREMSAYHHVKNNTKYPAVLFVHGVNDNRVPVWMTLKMAARLQEATSSGQPIQIRLDYDSGHGGQQPMSTIVEKVAENLSYLFWKAGKADFQPAGKEKGF